LVRVLVENRTTAWRIGQSRGIVKHGPHFAPARRQAPEERQMVLAAEKQDLLSVSAESIDKSL